MFMKGKECWEKWNCTLIIWTVLYGKGKFGYLTIPHPVRGVRHWQFCILYLLRLHLQSWRGYASNWSWKTGLSPRIRCFIFCTLPVSEKTRYCTIANCNCLPTLRTRSALSELRLKKQKKWNSTSWKTVIITILLLPIKSKKKKEKKNQKNSPPSQTNVEKGGPIFFKN